MRVIGVAEFGEERGAGLQDFVEEVIVAEGVGKEGVASGEAEGDKIGERGADVVADVGQMDQV